MRLVSVLLALAAVFLTTAVRASRLTPPVLPLIVRNPYLSAWLQNARDLPWESWPMFWTGENIGFSVLASLPHEHTAYPLLGRVHDSLSHSDSGYNLSFPTYNGAHYDASSTNLSYTIPLASSNKKDLEITLSFLSPLTPTSTLRQSIPAAYLTVYVSGHADVDIYVDLNGQWVSGDRGSQITWALEETHLEEGKTGLKTWSVRRAEELYFTEYRDQPEWGTLYFSGPSDVCHEAGVSSMLRQRFSRTGTLQNMIDNEFRAIMDEEPVFAFSKSFRTNTSSHADIDDVKSVMFTVAHIQNPVVQFAAARGLTQLRPLWATTFSSPRELLNFHFHDFEHAKTLAGRYDTQLAKDAFQSGADDYVDIVSLSARQVMGATHFLGTPEDPLLFIKEISSDGNTQTIDVIYPAFPFFLYTNPRWLAYLLEPLLEHMGSGQYPNKYAMHDLGSSYPNATGHPDGRDEYMPVEECGNILITALALANSIKYNTTSSVSSTWKQTSLPFSENSDKAFPLTVGTDEGMEFIDEAWGVEPKGQKRAKKWIDRSYGLWTQWTGYLVDFSLRPESQLSTDDFAGWLALQTNLALKGIIGIQAMASLAKTSGREDDVRKYENISREYIRKWEAFGISRDKTHAKLAYNWFGSWTTTYNLYADSLLCFMSESDEAAGESKATMIESRITGQRPMLGDDDVGQNSTTQGQGFVPKHIYQMQSDWYFSVRQKYGLPLDSRHLYTKTDWEFFAMAVAAPRVRAEILESVAKWINETCTDRPLTDLHDTNGDGGFPGINFFARPVIGGHFAFLALERACGGKAMTALKFLNDDIVNEEGDGRLDVPRILAQEVEEARIWSEEL